MSVDWRDMLWRYSGQVAEAEGVDFLWNDSGRWTAEEWAALKELWAEHDSAPRWG